VRLSRVQRNQVFGEIQTVDLDPRDFTWAVFDDDDRLIHAPTQQTFTFSDFDVLSGPAIYRSAQRLALSLTSAEYALWRREMRRLRAWLAFVAEEFNTPDLWAQRDEQEFWSGGSSDNSPFTAGEQATVVAELRRLAERIKDQHDLSEVQIRRVQENVDQLIEASKVSGRRDWAIMFVNVVAAWAFTEYIPGEVVAHAIQSVGHALSSFFVPDLPQLPGSG
jgi:hypothetical protein